MLESWDPQVKGKRRGHGSKGDKASDPESGVSRDIDSHNMSAVLTFDLSPTAEAYVHRAGRRARANNPGIVLTFVLPTEQSCLGKIKELLGGKGEAPLLLPYQFQMEEIVSFRYYCKDVMHSVTKQAIREARLKEIKEELLHSEKLKTYFEDNPRDLQLLRHDLPIHPAVVKPHLVPAALHGLVHPRKKQRKMPFSRKAKRVKTQNPLGDFKHRGKKT